MFKKKKCFNMATKSVKCKLKDDDFNFMETKTAFNLLIAFYFALVNTQERKCRTLYRGWGLALLLKINNWRRSTVSIMLSGVQ